MLGGATGSLTQAPPPNAVHVPQLFHVMRKLCARPEKRERGARISCARNVNNTGLCNSHSLAKSRKQYMVSTARVLCWRRVCVRALVRMCGTQEHAHMSGRPRRGVSSLSLSLRASDMSTGSYLMCSSPAQAVHKRHQHLHHGAAR